jgi:hypothetical protein
MLKQALLLLLLRVVPVQSLRRPFLHRTMTSSKRLIESKEEEKKL